jgi:hypothetical protein
VNKVFFFLLYFQTFRSVREKFYHRRKPKKCAYRCSLLGHCWRRLMTVNQSRLIVDNARLTMTRKREWTELSANYKARSLYVNEPEGGFPETSKILASLNQRSKDPGLIKSCSSHTQGRTFLSCQDPSPGQCFSSNLFRI